MNQDEIIPGKEYALREPPRRGIDMERVRVLERVRPGRWRVEWIEPNAGLTDFVKSSNLIVAWKDHMRFLRPLHQRSWRGLATGLRSSPKRPRRARRTLHCRSATLTRRGRELQAEPPSRCRVQPARPKHPRSGMAAA
jgi:hypothetical protein